MSVVKFKDLPDYRDGLKPLHRKIIYAASQEGITSERRRQTSAALVASVMGSYHPHADMSIYDALASMSQDFRMRYPLIDGQGNFGSIDGDSPAAMRFTEVRLSQLSSQFIDGLGEDWVEMVDNYDQRKKEPVVLPTIIPNILVNGCESVASNIPPHNLGEVLDAVVALIKDPNLPIERIKDYIKGPDFPTGGELLDYEGVLDYYGVNTEKKRNRRFTLRARVEVEKELPKKGRIIITEIPYGVKKSSIIRQIIKYMNPDPKTGKHIKEFDLYIKWLSDDSNMDGIRIVIEYSGCPAYAILNSLYKYTNLQVSFRSELVVLINNEPKQLNLYELLRLYIDYQFELLRKQAKYRKDFLRRRIHILEGRLTVEKDILEAIRIVTTSNQPEEDLQRKYGLSDDQLKDVLDLVIRSLKRPSIEEMQEEKKKRIEEANWNERLLESQEMQKEELIKRLENIKEKHGDSRRTIIRENESGLISTEEIRNYQNVLMICTKRSFLSQIPLSSRFFQTLRKGRRSKDSLWVTLYKGDYLKYMVSCNEADDLLFFTEGGRVYKKKSYELNLKNGLEQLGEPIWTYIPNLDEKDSVAQIIRLRKEDYTNPDMFLIFVTSLGYAKKIHISKFKKIYVTGKKAIEANGPRGKLKFVLKNSQPNQELMMVSTEQPSKTRSHEINNLVRVSIDSFFSFREKGENSKRPLASSWKKALKLKEGQEVLSASTTHEGETLVRMDTDGRIAVFDWNNFATTTRNAAKGVVGFKTKKTSSNRCVGFALAKPEDFILFTSSQGNIYKTSVEKWEIKKGRNIQGSYVLHEDLKNEGVSVTGFITLPTDDLEDVIGPEEFED